MKKFFPVIAVLALLVSTAGCTVEVTPFSSSESSSESSSSSSSSSSKSSSSSSESSSSKSESSKEEPSEPSRSDSGSESSRQQDEMEGKVAYSLIKMFENKRFYLRFFGDMGVESGANSIMEFAMQDDKIAIRMEMEEAGGIFRMVMADGKLVYLFDGLKTIMYMPLTEENNLTWDSMDTQGLQYIGMGSEEFRGRMLPYEEYRAESGTTRYFFSGKNVVGIRSFSNTPGEAPTDMEILEMSENIPIGIFDIPKDYVEMS